MRAEGAKKLFTVEEYYRLAEVGILDPEARLELLEGEIVEMSLVGVRHINCVNRANNILMKRLGDRVIVSVQNPVQLSDYSETQPDVVLLKPREDYYESKKISWEDALLVVEVSDTTIRRDRNIKLPLYAKAGVAELWIEDLRKSTILVYRDPQPEGYALVTSFQRGDTISLQAFPQILFKVEELIGWVGSGGST